MRNNFSTLGTAKQQKLSLYGLILLELRTGDHSRIWLDTALLLLVDTLHDTAFLDGFIPDMFLSERKVDSWQYNPIAIPNRPQLAKIDCMLQHEPANLAASVYSQARVDLANDVLRAARHIVLNIYIHCHVFVNTNSDELFTLDLRDLPIGRHSTLAGCGVIDTSTRRPSCILANSCSGREIRLYKRMILAHKVDSLNVIQPVDQNAYPLRTSEVDVHLSEELC